jgi:hypothetical protein
MPSDAEKLAQLQAENERLRREVAKWQRYVDTIIGIAAPWLRLHVKLRLDSTGRSFNPEGLWNRILDRTQDLKDDQVLAVYEPYFKFLSRSR